MPPHKYNEHTVPHFGAGKSTTSKTFVDSDDEAPAPPPPPPAPVAAVAAPPAARTTQKTYTPRAAPPAFTPRDVPPPAAAAAAAADVPAPAPFVRKGPVDQHAAKNPLPPTTKFNTVHHFGGQATTDKVKFDDSDDEADTKKQQPAVPAPAPFVRKGPVDQHAAKNALPPSTKFNTVHHFGAQTTTDKVKFDDSDDDVDPTVRKQQPAAPPSYTGNKRDGNTTRRDGNDEGFKKRRVEGGDNNATGRFQQGANGQQQKWKERKPPSAAALSVVIPLPPPVLVIPTVEQFVRSYYPKHMLKGLLMDGDDEDDAEEAALRKNAKNTTRTGVWMDASDEEIDEAELIRREEKKHTDLFSTVLALTVHTSRRCHGIIGEMNKGNNPSYVIPAEEGAPEKAKAAEEDVDNAAAAGDDDDGEVGWGDTTIGGDWEGGAAPTYRYVDVPIPNMRCVFRKLSAMTRVNKARVMAAVSFVEVFYPRLIMMMQLQHEYGDHYSNEMAAIAANNAVDAPEKKDADGSKDSDKDDILRKVLKPHTHPILVARLPALVKRRLELYGRYGLLGASAAAAAAAAAVAVSGGGAAAAAPAAAANSGNHSNEEVRSVVLLDDEDVDDEGSSSSSSSESVLLSTIKEMFESKKTMKLCKTFNMTFALTHTPIAKKAAADAEAGAEPPLATSTIVANLNGLARMSKKDREEARLRGEMAALMTKEDSSRICIVSRAAGKKKKGDAVTTYLDAFSTAYNSTAHSTTLLFSSKPVTVPAPASEDEKPLPPSQRYLMQLPVPTAVGTVFRLSGVAAEDGASDVKAAKKALEDLLAPLVTTQQSARKVFPRIVVVE